MISTNSRTVCRRHIVGGCTHNGPSRVWEKLFQIVLDEYQKTVGYDVRELFGDATFVEDRKGGF